MTVAALYKKESDRKLIMNAYKSLLGVCKHFSKADKVRLRKAFEVATEAHKDMRRKSGEPYILHPITVAKISVKDIGLGITGAMCALLHDTVEDTHLTLEDVEREFGKPIAMIVDGLTKISGVFELKDSIQAENFRKIILTLTEDVRVILVKIADRLHNMRTLDSMPDYKQVRVASETKFLYAPLSHRLGLYAIKSELEDLSMKYTDRKTYKDIANKLAEKKREREKFIRDFVKPIKQSLIDAGMDFYEIKGRPKSIYSIYNKMVKKSVEFHEVYDLFAIRIILNSTPEDEKADCWKAYSIITDHYTPNPNRLRDWISTPKANGYESLHTTVMTKGSKSTPGKVGKKGKWVEVQIRSKRMDEIAEKGFAAHWKYKDNEKEKQKEKGLDEWLMKIRETLQNPEGDALDFINDFKLDLFSKEIYVFTPKGDPRVLAAGSTALDFAFDIHTAIGLQCIGAKVNHKLVPISHVLSNGDQVEIITSKKQKPTEDWLKFTTTTRARSKIKSHLKEEKRRLAEDGRELLNRKLRSYKIPSNKETVHQIAHFFGYKDVLNFLYDVSQKKNVKLDRLKNVTFKGNELIIDKETAKLPKKEFTDETIKNKSKGSELLLFGDLGGDIDYTLAACCNPIPGDDVFGFITINQGIKIHRHNCPNASQLLANYSYRVIKTRWSNQKQIAFLAGIKITGLDDMGIIQGLTQVISEKLKVNMRSIQVDAKDGIFEGKLMVFVDDTQQLDKLIIEIKKLKGIISVNRFENV